MGYQESLFYIRPQWMFDAMIRKCEQAEETGYYDITGAEPVSIITLKKFLGGIPPGSRLLWVCGDRCFHNEQGILDGSLADRRHKLIVIPAERLFLPENDPKLKGINLNTGTAASENAFLRRESFSHYAQRMHSREEMER